ncbi:hypothetical protein CPC08DRAFT_793341 [Agrocybe pediades]|nr:hypothetical protein CPC08DRAFT_793341 [Agrocybe pediades]
MMEKWNTAIYALWHPVLDIGYDDGQHYHEFTCFKSSWKRKADATLTGNLYKHSQKCWGEDVIELTMKTANATDAWEALAKSRDGSMTVTYTKPVSCGVRVVFAQSHQHISAMLHKYNGKLHFATDAWTSPNYWAFVAVMVHFEHDGAPVCLILDIIKVAKLHTGVNLVVAFADILKKFGIKDKISPHNNL